MKKPRTDPRLRARRTTHRLVAVVAAALIASATGPTTLAAQAAGTGKAPLIVKVGKWAFLGAAVVLGVQALRASNDAADAYDGLRALCLDAPARCAHPDGAYVDPEAEGLYDRSLSADRRAQRAIYAGEAALIGSVALFIIDLRDDGSPPTIPYPGDRRDANGRLVLLSVAF
jgi:hypothetical protein